ncbi:MAG TPA: hypothetical protein VKD08_14015 [Ignavibacteriaceae bacterium]|nr:hypothetical protein [Ignavibacteriaceae bacterium]
MAEIFLEKKDGQVLATPFICSVKIKETVVFKTRQDDSFTLNIKNDDKFFNDSFSSTPVTPAQEVVYTVGTQKAVLQKSYTVTAASGGSTAAPPRIIITTN